jgi:hypothetical protein
VRVLSRIRLKLLLALYSAINLSRGNNMVFHNPVGNHRSGGPVEKVQDPVMNPSQTDSEFVDSVAQKVSFRPPQFVPQIAQAL